MIEINDLLFNNKTIDTKNIRMGRNLNFIKGEKKNKDILKSLEIFENFKIYS